MKVKGNDEDGRRERISVKDVVIYFTYLERDDKV